MVTLAIIIGMLLATIFIGSWWYFSEIKHLGAIRSLFLAKGIAILALIVIGVSGYVLLQ